MTFFEQLNFANEVRGKVTLFWSVYTSFIMMNRCYSFSFVCTLYALLFVCISSFNPSTNVHNNRQRTTLFMGRASVVRAATKARTDAARQKNNGIFGKRIVMAAKAGGPDPTVNKQLAQVIADAKAAMVPKDIITRNLEKLKSPSSLVDFKESIFEFYGHGGVGLLVNVLTDNDNRANKDVQCVARKHELKPASINSVAFKFAKKARLNIPKAIVSEEDLMNICLENNVDDYLLATNANGCPLNPAEEGSCVVYVKLQDMAIVRDKLREKGYEVESKIAHIPLDGFVDVTEEEFEANMAAIEALEALDDVQFIEHNICMTESEPCCGPSALPY